MGKPYKNTLEKIQRIKEAYEIEGKLTIRRIYYILLTHGLVTTAKSAYVNLSHLLVKLREWGHIDPDIIIDRHRIYQKRPTYKDFQEAFDSLYSRFAYDSMEEQEKYIEVWIEKDTMINKFEGECWFNDVPLVVSKGFTSYTFKLDAIKRFEQQAEKSILILYFGDFDAEGEYIPEKVKQYINKKLPDIDFELRKVLLNEKDKEKLKRFAVIYKPKKKQLKKTYVQDFIRKHGKIKIEVEALSFAEIKERFIKELWKELDRNVVKNIDILAEQEKERWLDWHYHE